ncbi:DUF4365 domain-containing protein [Nocardia halotolerans]|uniref:DUF4365 domain-containing protein n=1 Tax=Nocardia halotolerans TaxID=1755878 RepID=A0ABV8VGH5_9NOCA
MPINDDTNRIDRASVGLCEFQINEFLGHTFREQTTSDFGVDAHVEVKRDGVPTGRLVGLQLKGGRSQFGEETDVGWKFRPKKKHIPYWLGHSLPMYLLLIDKSAQTIYWQELSERTLKTGPRGGVYVVVPKTQTLPSAGATWETAAEQFAKTALSDYRDNLTRLPSPVITRLEIFEAANADAAALLAAHLTRGRGAPEVVVRTLLGSAPAWLSPDGTSDGLVILANYAHAHGLPILAVDVLLAAAEQTPELKFRYTRDAGLTALEFDQLRAQELLAVAASMPEASGDVHLEIGCAVLAHPEGSAAPVPLTEEFKARLEAIADDELVISFLARQSEHADNLDRAVELFERALARVPESAGLMSALARVLSRRARTPSMQPTDQRRAVQFASDAVDRIHAWSGPTEFALHTLLQCLLVAGQFSKVLDRSLPAPDGRATFEESQRLDICTFAATAATALGRRDLALQLIESLPPGADRDLARLRLGDEADEDGDQKRALISLAERLDKTRPEALLQVVMRLSDLGVDESVRLDPLVADRIIAADLRDLAAISAKAHADLDAVLPELRLLAERDELAARKLIDYLADANRIDDAEVAAEAAHLRFGIPDFALRRAELLIRLQRLDEAHDTATDVLASSVAEPVDRRAAHQLLARLLWHQALENPADSRIFSRLERQLIECVNSDELTVEERDVWQLLEVQMRLAKEDDAFATLSRYEPAIVTPDMARLWFSVVMTRPTLAAPTYARMLQLADTFAAEAELSAGLLTAVITRTRDADDELATPVDQRPILDRDRRAAAFAALDAHVERHGDRSPIKILQAPTSEDLIAQMTDLTRRDERPLIELVQMIRQARLPLGMLALAAGRPYSSTLATRPLGYFISAAAIEEDDSADEEAARAASNRDVVVDASTLLVAGELGEFDNFRGKFRSLLIPLGSYTDIRAGRAVLEGRSSSSSSIRYDARTDSIVAVEIEIEGHLEALARFSKIDRALAATRTVENATLEEVNLPGAAPWLGPIALAKRRGVQLWSDDLAQRRLARSLGVEAFGTSTLQQLRTASRLENGALDETQYKEILEIRRREILDALGAHIVDVPTDCQVVVDRGSSEEWDEQVALVTVGRPGWWHMAVNSWKDLQYILAAVERESGPSDTWRYQAMWGVTQVAPDDSTRVAMLLACTAMITVGDTVQEDRMVEHLTVACEIATQSGAKSPMDFLVEAATVLESAGASSPAPVDVARLRSRLSRSDD